MRPILFAWLAGAIALIVVAFFLEPFVVVPAGSRGVLLDFGAVQPEPLAPGLHLITPIVQSVVEMDTRVQLHQDTEEAASHDLQDVHASVATNWRIKEEAAPHLYQTIGPVRQILDRLIVPAIANTIKAVTAHFDAEELINATGSGRRSGFDSPARLSRALRCVGRSHQHHQFQLLAGLLASDRAEAGSAATGFAGGRQRSRATEACQRAAAGGGSAGGGGARRTGAPRGAGDHLERRRTGEGQHGDRQIVRPGDHPVASDPKLGRQDADLPRHFGTVAILTSVPPHQRRASLRRAKRRDDGRPR